MIMFGITTLMFVLGIIRLVLETVLAFQLFFDLTAGDFSSTYSTSVIIATVSRLMVRLQDAPIPSAPLN